MTDWFSAKEIAAKLRVDRNTIHNWANRWHWKRQAAYIPDEQGKSHWGFEYSAVDVDKTLNEVNKDKLKLDKS
jgi:uncharacterized protein YjcR